MQSFPNHPSGEGVLYFVCRKCKTKLSAPDSYAGQIAPCPVCGARVTAPSAPASPFAPAAPRAAPVPPLTPVQKAPQQRRRSGVIADVAVNQTDLERREIWRILRMLGWFVLAGMLCAGVVWFLKDWARH